MDSGVFLRKNTEGIFMIGIIVNVAAVVFGGILGTLFSQRLSTRFITELNKVFGVCAMGMGISSIPLMENMPAVILAMVLGTALGLACHLGEWISRGGALLEKPISRLLGDRSADSGLSREEYLSLLVTAIVLFCSSGTGIYGCLDAGMTGNATVLLSKSILDLFTAMVFACNLGAVTSLVAVPQLAIFLTLFFAANAISHLKHSKNSGFPGGGHDSGHGAGHAPQRPMGQLGDPDAVNRRRNIKKAMHSFAHCFFTGWL